MEKDIEDLKELRKELGLHTDGNKIKQGIALEYLIKAYKELKENSMPVSLVEETIEELGNMTLLTVAQRQEVSYAIAVLQELLEKGK